jgi:manganese/zinc/iron transport system permease protein
MVIMTFFFFLVAWVASPRYGLVSTLLRRQTQRRRFTTQLLLGHIAHHQETHAAADELNINTLHEHFDWSPEKVARTVRRVRESGLVQMHGSHIALTEKGRTQAALFRQRNLAVENPEHD